eukprot:1152402-Pelagomonas_calceolata.AAC.14
MALPHTAGYIVHNCHVDCIVHTQEGVSTKYGVLFTASVPTALQPSSHHRIVSYETSSLAFGLSEAQDTEQAIRKQLDVNEAGSKLCGMLVKGDCFIVHSRDKQQGGKELLRTLGLLESARQVPGGKLQHVKQQKNQHTARHGVRHEAGQQLPAQHAAGEAQPKPPLSGQLVPFEHDPAGQQNSTPSTLPCVHHLGAPEPCLKPLSLHEPAAALCEGRQHAEPTPPSQRGSHSRPNAARPSLESLPSGQFDPHPQPPEVPCWTDLPPEMIGHIFQALVGGSKSFSACLPLMQTCRTFRQVGEGMAGLAGCVLMCPCRDAYTSTCILQCISAGVDGHGDEVAGVGRDLNFN